MFLNGGISAGYAISGSAYRKIDSRVYTSEYQTEEDALPGIRKLEESVLVGAGVRFGKFSLELRYNLGNGMSTSTEIHSLTNRYNLLAGYRF